MRRALASVAALLCSLTVLTACGSDSPDEADTGPRTIEVTFEGESVAPNGERVEVAVGQDVELDVTADAPGTIHVHSSPEQELQYDAGESTLTIDGIDKPGTVDVESHELEKVVVQLEVR
ncbi:MAG: hypothetical protein HYU55_04665 [Nocardioides sp.]|nr:hypothetical protein [Nocardioides sp.]